ncbi:hypothetical protein [Streptomyces shenzhenensis]|uniref:Uncharacterized protein n=1 Tax=Streptomyces shenzhenensis TaxID=943815 RepID=A0A3M0I4Z1_9ACTN|nr:hypothetical protein [Streptomyces shenzhenensis]RMB81793.1 hypothetical protein CTZ28_32475 [Streptomyces shenzhenensis]
MAHTFDLLVIEDANPDARLTTKRSAGIAAMCRRSSAASSWPVAQFPAPLRSAVEPQWTSPDLLPRLTTAAAALARNGKNL